MCAARMISPPLWLLTWLCLAIAQNAINSVADSIIKREGVHLHYRILTDGFAHGFSAVLCWQTTVLLSQEMYSLLAYMRLMPRTNQSQRAAICTEILVAFFSGTLIDLDHFVAAGSISLNSATNLKKRPFAHNLFFVFFLSSFLAFIPWDSITQQLHSSIIIPLSVYIRRHVALHFPAVQSCMSRNFVRLVFCPCITCCCSTPSHSDTATTTGSRRLAILVSTAMLSHLSRDAMRRGFNIVPWSEFATPKISHMAFLLIVCVAIPVVGAVLIAITCSCCGSSDMTPTLPLAGIQGRLDMEDEGLPSIEPLLLVPAGSRRPFAITV